MDIVFKPVLFAEIQEPVRRHLAGLRSKIDSFLEDHILASNHYRIEISGEFAGFTSIHNEQLITLFCLDNRYKRDGQAVYVQVRLLEQVQSAFIPTCDEFFLSHALDDYRVLAKQAYFFAVAHDSTIPVAQDRHALQLATPGDTEFIRRETGDFFEHLERHIVANEFFLSLRGNKPVGFGIAVRSSLYEDVASIGMFTIERFRQHGVGTATIALLINECRRSEIQPIAGCWYYNHLSKKTLERAGMFSSTRLLKIDY